MRPVYGYDSVVHIFRWQMITVVPLLAAFRPECFFRPWLVALGNFAW